MSEPLSEDQLAELIRSGRISTSKSASKRGQTKRSNTINHKPTKTQTSASRVTDSPTGVDLTTTPKEVDQVWLKAEKEKAERNISAQRQDKRRIEEMREASRF